MCRISVSVILISIILLFLNVNTIQCRGRGRSRLGARGRGHGHSRHNSYSYGHGGHSSGDSYVAPSSSYTPMYSGSYGGGSSSYYKQFGVVDVQYHNKALNGDVHENAPTLAELMINLNAIPRRHHGEKSADSLSMEELEDFLLKYRLLLQTDNPNEDIGFSKVKYRMLLQTDNPTFEDTGFKTNDEQGAGNQADSLPTKDLEDILFKYRILAQIENPKFEDTGFKTNDEQVTESQTPTTTNSVEYITTEYKSAELEQFPENDYYQSPVAEYQTSLEPANHSEEVEAVTLSEGGKMLHKAKNMFSIFAVKALGIK